MFSGNQSFLLCQQSANFNQLFCQINSANLKVMRILLPFLIITLLISCNNQSNTTKQLQAQIDSLHFKLDHTYKPGFGEFMSGIQTHHAKLWFAGQNQNWQLANFEITEIKESLDDIKTFCTDRPETKSIGMIDAALDSISNAIQQKDITTFRSSYVLLTNTCNNCHHETAHAFNVIKIPDTPPFSNQDFKVGR